MKFPSVKYRTQYLTIALGIIMIMVLSCENKLDSISKFDLFVLPSLTGKDIETVLIDSGRLQLVMYAPRVEQYNNTDLPYSEFRSGIRIVFHEGKQETVGTVTAKYAKYTKSNNLWELKDSVVVVNEGNDKLETEVLYWNQEKDL
ncbi:MAG: LPS export ABC transporter periplasmic protein LptC, partial [Bacteroidia bacterium]|nr:LPS export ABC transporter periplasmic protein LptC [Bacteroidia bacterium]